MADDNEHPDFDRLWELDLAVLLDGDPRYVSPPGVAFYDVDGAQLPGDIREQAFAFEERLADPANHFRTSLWWGNTPVEVFTVYLGSSPDYTRTRHPLIWETMIFTELRSIDRWQLRYGSRNAAWLGHRRIIACLLDIGLVLANLHEAPASAEGLQR